MGVSERTIMGVMGWSNTAMAQRYAHIIDPIRRDTARRIDQLLWAESHYRRAVIHLVWTERGGGR